jgi:hypothetical protein
VRAKVTTRKQDADGNPIGKSHSNPILDSRLYEVEFPDGSTDLFTANTIAESMYSQIDDEGHTYQLMDEIIDHQKDGTAVSKGEGSRMTTKGWKLLVQWKDKTLNWIDLKDLKESNPIETAEYAVANQISDEPAFAWWVRKVLRRRDRILSRRSSRGTGNVLISLGLSCQRALRRRYGLTGTRGPTSGERQLKRK